MNQPNAVQAHYTSQGMLARTEEALAQSGLGTGPLDWSQLAGMDQFHVRGLPATQELAAALNVEHGQRVLDVGSGLGGPARYLAAVHSCDVRGIELSPEFVEIARLLTVRTGLQARVHFVQGDALNLPFAPETFDHAWTQHVGMNIRDKAQLYQGIYSVLKPGGRLAIYDAVRGEHEPVIYPVPWAGDASISFLASSGEMEQLLENAGFALLMKEDTTAAARDWFTELQRATPPAGPPNLLNLAQVIGPQARQMTANFGRNIMEGRLRLLRIIVQKRS
ncbi:class I SAM-dependent methyltransferase [Deinococcus ruber]|uniref:SAM-dependent methyltransferase n=1 Tax=Deinococcus ruber TaxID=1848197 RepID=A0A918CF47_9DEIO|nr:class I SAM-dependent methyltransferase [Deinococcus ruber]GGR22120.1 SAM-dependent methyltransferase [Deinococcus ruber]